MAIIDLAPKQILSRIELPRKNFGFFKFALGSTFLIAVAAHNSIASYSFLIALAVGKAHSLGAWIAMWRSGKLNWRYITSMFFISIAVSYWGLKMVDSLETLSFITYTLFSFHFLFDEFDLQEEARTQAGILASISPAFLLLLLLARDFLHINITDQILWGVTLSAIAIECIYLKKINWFFLHTKVLTLFILGAAQLGMSAGAILATFLIFHYFFWFIYPVYKLHKYKPEERDNFIMILVLIVSTSFYFAVTRNLYGEEILNLTIRAFLIGTIIHILSTAPFGYLFGLPKKKLGPVISDKLEKAATAS